MPRRPGCGRQGSAAASAAKGAGRRADQSSVKRADWGFREACRFGGFVKPADQACARRNPSATMRRSFVAPPFERGSLLLPHFGD